MCHQLNIGGLVAEESNKEISVRLGNMWKNLPQATKDLYYERASKSKAEHRAKHSAYVWHS